ncbi:MAG: DUF1641 domain-containing protein [Desulfurococcales archaeon]|nr:DUF1641 domain-containing protein [Desulfurococcales archaeon]
MAERDELMEVIDKLGQPEVREALVKAVDLLANLERSGLLDLLIALTDEDVVKRIVQLVMTTGTMKLADNLPELLDKLGAIAATLAEPAEPLGITGLLESLKDPAVARGLSRLVTVLRALGGD